MYKSETLTNSPYGHTLHHNGVFSNSGEWLVYDCRNDETKIGETEAIGLLNLKTQEERIIYKTKNQTQYGPGVGAASFNPKDDKVIFIHGLIDADKRLPYDISRRTGMIVDVNKAGVGVYADARDVTAPYVSGSLRGGTHSHCWSPDGTMASFTYNDEFVDSDIRVVGVMIKLDSLLQVDKHAGNNNGTYHSVIVSDVKNVAKPGSDEITRAFDECWVAGQEEINGIKHDAIAFQGNTTNSKGDIVTEIYLIEIDKNTITVDKKAVGVEGERPTMPRSAVQRRLTRSSKGLSDFRHWLRSSNDGKYIYALAKDDQDYNQLVQCDVVSGELTYLSAFDFSVNSPINLDNKSELITFVANNQVYIFNILTKELTRLTDFDSNDLRVMGVPSFSPDDKYLVFNQLVESDNNNKYVQIKRVEL